MIAFHIDPLFKSACPNFKGVALFATIQNTTYSSALWTEITSFQEIFRSTTQINQINTLSAIKATRNGYKATGKDPNRYRPSAEALCRRVLRGLPLYQISTAVDLINLLSLKTGYSIGGFDADKIEGNTLSLGIGCEGEPYEGIARGELNIEGMPVYRDNIGGVGTPTSDNERTKLGLETTYLLMIINEYDDKGGVETAIKEAKRLLTNYCNATNIEIAFFQ